MLFNSVPRIRNLFYFHFLVVGFSCSDVSNHNSFSTFKVQMENNFGLLEFSAPSYLDSTFYRDTVSEMTCSEEATYLFDVKKEYIKNSKNDDPVPDLIHTLGIAHSAIKDCGVNDKDSLEVFFSRWHKAAKIHTIYFSSKVDTKNGPTYILAHGSGGHGNALLMMNVNGLLLNITMLISNISGDLNKKIIHIANSVTIKEKNE